MALREVPLAHGEFLAEALAEARKALQEGEVPVGAVLVRDGQILARSHNRREASGDPTAHAEVLALRAAGETQGNWRLTGTVLYVTLEPCPMCAWAIRQARVKQVVFGASDAQVGAAGSHWNLLWPEVESLGGIQEAECESLLREFFQERRD